MSGIDFNETCADGYELTGTLYRSDPSTEKATVIICGALGVSRHFYKPFARYLSKNHFTAITFDYRGTGDSNADWVPENLNLEDWGIQDMDTIIQYAAKQIGAARIFLVGHSVGGQLFCLSQNCQNLTGAVLVCASFPHWSRWPFPRNLLMFFFWYILIPSLSLGRKKFPTRLLGLSKENLPVSFIKRWAEWARDTKYVTSKKFSLDTGHFETLAIPVLSYGFDDDTYAPQKSIQKLHHAFKNTLIEERHMTSRKLHPQGIGHFGYFKKTCGQSLWEETIHWMSNR